MTDTSALPDRYKPGHGAYPGIGDPEISTEITDPAELAAKVARDQTRLKDSK